MTRKSTEVMDKKVSKLWSAGWMPKEIATKLRLTIHQVYKSCERLKSKS